AAGALGVGRGGAARARAHRPAAEGGRCAGQPAALGARHPARRPRPPARAACAAGQGGPAWDAPVADVLAGAPAPGPAGALPPGSRHGVPVASPSEQPAWRLPGALPGPLRGAGARRVAGALRQRHPARGGRGGGARVGGARRHRSPRAGRARQPDPLHRQLHLPGRLRIRI
ncbi:MAG: hypothetical protein AVDCRST_MAG68-570, partial [uncultured Gemmatimonadetes bacterium]